MLFLMGQAKENHLLLQHQTPSFEDQWMIEDQSSSFEDTSTSSHESSSLSSSSLDDDASSHSPSPLYQLSDLISQLPIKRGLSKFYEGKSQSYTSLSRVMSLEDLAKKESPYRKKMKTCRSYGGCLDTQKSSYTLPKPTIVKKVSSPRVSSLSSLSIRNNKSAFLNSCCKPPLVPSPQKHFC